MIRRLTSLVAVVVLLVAPIIVAADETPERYDYIKINGFAIYGLLSRIDASHTNFTVIFTLPSGKKIQIFGNKTLTAEDARKAMDATNIEQCTHSSSRLVFRAVVPRLATTPWYVAEFGEKTSRWAEVGSSNACPESAAPAAWR